MADYPGQAIALKCYDIDITTEEAVDQLVDAIIEAEVYWPGLAAQVGGEILRRQFVEAGKKIQEAFAKMEAAMKAQKEIQDK